MMIYILELQAPNGVWFPYGDFCNTFAEAQKKLIRWQSRDKRWDKKQEYRIAQYERIER